jgi:CBS domain-containing protein
VDPLEILFAREVMRTYVAAFTTATKVEETANHLRPDHSPRGQHLYPVLDSEDRLAGVITRKDLRTLAVEHEGAAIGEFARSAPAVAYANEPLRVVVDRMAASGFTRMPVLDTAENEKLVGMISLEDLLRARARNLSEERDRERVIRIRLPFSSAVTSEKEF